jgi:hypothetical protein
MTAIQILEEHLNKLLDDRKKFYTRYKRSGTEQWVEDKFIKWNKERTITIKNIRKAIKILK